MNSVFRSFEGYGTTSLKKLDLIALLFIKLYYNKNFEIDFLEITFSVKCLSYLIISPDLRISSKGRVKLISCMSEEMHGIRIGRNSDFLRCCK